MIEKLKSISKTKWILMGALAVVIIIVLILLLARPKEKTVSLFEDQYPMKVTQTSEGGLVIELDGSKTKDVDWEIEERDSDDPVSSVSTKENDNGVLFITVTPLHTGFDKLKIKKYRKIMDVSYEEADILIEYAVSEEGESLFTFLTNTVENTADSEAGALDTEYPYLIVGNTVYFPNVGDWRLYNADLGKDVSDEDINSGRDDEGRNYSRVDYLDDSGEKNLILASETLQIEVPLKATYNEDGTIKIEKVQTE